MATLEEKNAETMRLIAKIERKYPEGEGTTLLVSPACEKGCPACFRECALGRIAIAAHRIVMDARTPSFIHEGVAYGAPEGRA